MWRAIGKSPSTNSYFSEKLRSPRVFDGLSRYLAGRRTVCKSRRKSLCGLVFQENI